jgi:hypothetical protein
VQDRYEEEVRASLPAAGRQKRRQGCRTPKDPKNKSDVRPLHYKASEERSASESGRYEGEKRTVPRSLREDHRKEERKAGPSPRQKRRDSG